MAIIYKTTCLLNGKIYIGQSKHNKSSYLGSGKLILHAIKKYGKVNFIKEVLIDDDLSKEDIDQLEIYFISEYNSTEKSIGYNIEFGGSGNSDRQNSNISKSQKGRKLSEETKKKISKSKIGTKASEESKINQSKSLIGNKNRLGVKHTDDDKLKISNSMKNHYENEENRIKSSIVAKKRISDGKCLEGVNIITSKENQIYATECARLVNSKSILVIDIDNNELLNFESLNSCREFFGIKGNSQLIHCLKNDKLYKKKFILKYI